MKKRIAFIWYWDKASETYPNWRDGLRKAMELIGEEHEVVWFFDKNIPETDDWDAIYFWDDSNSSFFKHIDKYHCKKGLCLTTSPSNFDNLRKLDVVFCESKVVLEQVRSQGIHGVLAFGTDSDFYTPDPTVEKDIKYLCVSCFSPWKRQRDIAYLGKDLYCVGGLEPDGQEDYQAVVDAGATVEVGYFSAEHIRDLYRRAENVIIPAKHGSERTVLESLSMGIVPILTDKNNKTYTLWREYLDSGLDSGLGLRDFILRNYSGQIYAKNHI